MKNDLCLEASVLIDASLATVWDALVNPAKIKLYLFGADTLTDWKVGSSIAFVGEFYGRKFHDRGTILEIVPGEILRFSYWNSGEGYSNVPENYSIITYHLSDASGEVLLHYRRDKIPTLVEKENSEKFIGGILNQIKVICERVTSKTRTS